METEAWLYLRVLILSFMESLLPTLILFSLFWSGLSIVKGTFLVTFSVSTLYELSLLTYLKHIWEMSSNVIIHLYLSPFGITIYSKFYLYCFFTISYFFLVCKCKRLVYKLCITFWKCQSTEILFILECI